MAVCRDLRADLGLAMIPRRFPPPWSVDEIEACFIVRDHNGQALAYSTWRRSRAHARRRSSSPGRGIGLCNAELRTALLYNRLVRFLSEG
jgi:hypothetical protein